MPFETLLPIFAYFLVGFLLRLFGLAGSEQAAFLFRLVFYVTLPALVFGTISDAELTRRTMLLPIAGTTVNLVCAMAAILYVRVTNTDNRRAGAVVLGAGIMNTAFVFPFVLAVLGRSALAEAVLFDLGNAVFVGLIAYPISLYFGNAGTQSATSYLFKTIRAPIFIAVAAALIVNLAQIPVPNAANNVLSPLGSATIPLILIAVGISFSTTGLFSQLTIATILLRMLLGFIVGLALVWVLGFAGVTAAVVTVLAAAPIGFNSVSLASIGKLDTEQAAASLSVSVGIGLVSTTLLLLATMRWFGVNI
jgi:predicted permease